MLSCARTTSRSPRSRRSTRRRPRLPDFEALLPMYHPDVEVHSPKEWVELGDFDPVYRGHEGLIRFYRQWADTWANNWAEPQELIDLGDRLVLLGEIYARSSASDIEVGR